jgi:hypothetical protein
MRTKAGMKTHIAQLRECRVLPTKLSKVTNFPAMDEGRYAKKQLETEGRYSASSSVGGGAGLQREVSGSLSNHPKALISRARAISRGLGGKTENLVRTNRPLKWLTLHLREM